MKQERFEELAKLAGNKLEDFEAVKKAYEEGKRSGLEMAHLIATKHIIAKTDSPCSDICTEIEEAIGSL